MTGHMLGNRLALIKHHRISNCIKVFLEGPTKNDPTDAQSPEIFESAFKYMEVVVYRVVNIVKFLAK